MKFLDKILNSIIINSTYSTNLGLCGGRMGMIIFLCKYARSRNKYIYNDLAELFIKDLFDDINESTPINFKDGLLGIAWGVEYLLRNDFVDGNSLEILEDVDEKIMKYDIHRIEDYSLYYGLSGLLHYIIFHLLETGSDKKPFDIYYMHSIDVLVHNLLRDDSSIEIKYLINEYLNWKKEGVNDYNPNVLLKRVVAESYHVDYNHFLEDKYAFYNK